MGLPEKKKTRHTRQPAKKKTQISARLKENTVVCEEKNEQPDHMKQITHNQTKKRNRENERCQKKNETNE